MRPDGDSSPEASSSAPATGRRYTDKEVALVIKRAAELQEGEARGKDSDGSGLSLTELEQIAREAGIDPSLVRRAAHDLDTRHSTASASRFLGAPSILVMERTIDGEVSPDQYETIVGELRRAFNDNGLVSTLGRSLAWSSMPQGTHRSGQHQVNVTVSPRDGRTTIRMEQSVRGLAGGLFGGIMGGVGGGTSGVTLGIGSAWMHSFFAAGVLWLGVVGASYLLARTIFTTKVKGRSERMRDVMDRIVEYVSAGAAQPRY